MKFLIKNKIDFEETQPNQYQATIKLINNGNNVKINNESISKNNKSAIKLSSSPGYYVEKQK